MPSLLTHPSSSFVKLLLVGDAMSGKTGSLVSLVPDYSLRIVDLDNKLDILRQVVLRECPDRADSIDYVTVADKREATAAGTIIKGTPNAYIRAIKLIDHWKYKGPDGTDVDLGRPSNWGPDHILVIDSFTRLCDAAYDWQEALTPAGRSGEKDGRAVYGNAQDAITSFVSTIMSPSFETNVIVIAHGSYYDLPDGSTKIFPQSVGQKLSPKIPTYFPNMIRYKNVAGKRTIQLKSDVLVDLANTAPFSMPDTLDIETGLAKFFAILRGEPAKQVAKPAAKAASIIRR